MAIRHPISYYDSLKGKVYGRWTILSHGMNSRSERIVQCRCECGNERFVLLISLTNGTSRSCGCYKKEIVGNRWRTHGMTKSPEYRSWAHMIDRCESPNDPAYPDYGGRRISVCQGWHSFEAFFADMGHKPGPRYSIGRVNNNGNYEPHNCRWETDIQQARNKRNNFLLAHNGEIRCLCDWATRMGIRHSTIQCRLQRGWSVDAAISKPVRKFTWRNHKPLRS